VSIVVADLLAELGVRADVSTVKQFTNEMQMAGKSGGIASRGVKIIGAAIAAVGVAAIGAAAGVIAFTNNVSQHADEIAKTARATGIASEEFQRLAHAAKLSDIDTRQLGKAFLTLRKGLDDFATKGASPVTDALAKLGITFDDLKGQGPTQQLGIVADALQGVGDEAEKSTILAEIFGAKAGPHMLNMLAEGSQGLQAMTGQLDTVFSDEQLAQAEAYQDSLTELGDRVDSAKKEIAFAFVPALLEASTEMDRWIGENDELIKQDLPRIFGEIVAGAVDVVQFLGEVVSETKILSMQLRQLDEDTGILSDAWAAMSAPFRAVASLMENTAAVLGDLIKKVAEFLGLGEQLRAFAASVGIVDDAALVGERQTQRGVGAGVKVVNKGQVVTGFLTKEPRQTMTTAQLEEIANNQNVRTEDREAAQVMLPRARQRDVMNAVTAGNKAARESLAKSAAEAKATEARRRRAQAAARRGKGGGKTKESKKELTLEELVDAATGEIGRDLPDVASRAPTVVVQITRNEVKIELNPTFPNVHDPFQAARQTVELVKRELATQNIQAGQAIAPGIVR
jgi:hypothetical protein